MSNEPNVRPEEQKQPIAATCPDCGQGKLRVTRFQANSGPPTFQLGQSSAYSHGEDNPTVTVECTNSDCSFTEVRPGNFKVGSFYPHTM
jgi:hypothetical protein